MKHRCASLLLLLFVLLPSLGHAQSSVEPAQPLVASFDIQPLEPGRDETAKGTSQGDGEQGMLLSQPIRPGWEFIAVAATWEKELPAEVTPHLEVRVATGEEWGEWLPLPVVEDERPDHASATFTELLFVRGESAQLRARLEGASSSGAQWEGLRLTLIDGRPGPSSAELAAASTTSRSQSSSAPRIISRQAWGANESYRYRDGEEIWPRRYHKLKALFVHHTATNPTYPDPAAAVRSIYYYHAVTLGWGDIGYHYVVDQYGNVYEGRFGGEQNGLVAEGGHALGYNENTMGVSVIGNYTSNDPSGPTLAALKELLAWRAARYGIDPNAPIWLNGMGSHPDRWFDHGLMGHRDSHEPRRTSCPGEALYAKLPEVRSYVSNRARQLAHAEVQLARPDEEAMLEGKVTFQANASPNVVRMEYFLDGSLIASSYGAPWEVEVDSRSLPAGSFTLRARGITEVETSATDEHTVRVAVMTDTLSLQGLDRNRDGGPVEGASVTQPSHTIFLPVVTTPLVYKNLIRNGAFLSNSDWIMLLGDYAARYVEEESWSAPRSLRAGMASGDNYPGFSSARLPVEIPADVKEAELTLRYLRRSGAASDDDRQYLLILDESGKYLTSIIPSGRSNDEGWQSATFDLLPYAGQTIFIYAGVKNDGVANSTALYIDDVKLLVAR